MAANYFRVTLGRGNKFVEDGHKGNYIGADFGISNDLTELLMQDKKVFVDNLIPDFLGIMPDKSKHAAKISLSFLWSVCKGINKGDIFISHRGDGTYYVGEVVGYYYYDKTGPLPHRRKVSWYPNTISKEDMSQQLINSAGSISTTCNLTKHAKELESLIGGKSPINITSNDEAIEDPLVFAMEMHLEDFLVKNWSQTEFSAKYEIYEDEEQFGKQFSTDTGPIDILAISKDKKEFLVIELKKGRASDSVVGQIQRYMGYVLDELAEEGQSVKGIIVALDDDIKIKRALSVTNNIELYKYQVNFNLQKSS